MSGGGGAVTKGADRDDGKNVRENLATFGIFLQAKFHSFVILSSREPKLKICENIERNLSVLTLVTGGRASGLNIRANNDSGHLANLNSLPLLPSPY